MCKCKKYTNLNKNINVVLIGVHCWTCSHCGTDNPIYRIDCIDCGKPRW